MRTILCELAVVEQNSTPPSIAGRVHSIIKNFVGIEDLYSEEKRRFNDFALKIAPKFSRMIISHRDGFLLRVKLSIAANIIDFGKNSNLTEKEAEICIENALEKSISGVDIEQFKYAIDKATKILFLCDNTGEIVFDKILIEGISKKSITCAVRGFPVINDATLLDAEYVGLTDVVKVISNGSNHPGTTLSDCSREFLNEYETSDLIIAKGQGNYETLSEVTDKHIFFLLQVKCPVIARSIGYPLGSFVAKEINRR
jgi:uncharacterized protein with ATP-grasp and redox domains